MDIVALDQQLTLALNGSTSPFWDNVVYTATNTFSWTLVIIALLIIFFKDRPVKDALLVLLSIALLILVADRLCSGLVKPMVARWRPTNDPYIMYMVDVVRDYRGGRFGFFSGHACNTFCMATFLSLLFRYRNLTLTLYFWAATTTFTRIYLGVHYVGDITVGLIIGCILGALFYRLYDLVQHRIFKRKNMSSSQFTPTGYQKSDLNALLSVIYINYCLVIIFAMTLGLG